jgi:hypothetical protein
MCPPGTGWDQVYPQTLDSLIVRLVQLARLRWKYSNPPPRDAYSMKYFKLLFKSSVRTSQINSAEVFMTNLETFKEFIPHRKHITSPVQRSTG